jgi:hypothetical protein
MVKNNYPHEDTERLQTSPQRNQQLLESLDIRQQAPEDFYIGIHNSSPYQSQLGLVEKKGTRQFEF